MARFLKINTTGYLQENSPEDIVYIGGANVAGANAGIVFDGATSPNITFTNNVGKVVGLATPLDTDIYNATNVQYVLNKLSSLSTGMYWQEAITNFVNGNEASSVPGETLGARYILIDFGNGTVDASWDGAAYNDIVEFNGTTWDNNTPSDGWVVYCSNDASPPEDKIWMFDTKVSPDSWIDIGAFANHNSLPDLQGGSNGQRYHLDLNDSLWVGEAGYYTSSTNWAVILPDETDAAGVTVNGAIRYNTSTDKVQVYDGSWNDITADSEIVTVNFPTDGVVAGDVVAITSAGKAIAAQATTANNYKAIGFAKTTVVGAGFVDVIICGAATVPTLSPVIAGSGVYLSAAVAGELVKEAGIPTAGGSVVLRIGYVKDATNVILNVGEAKIRTS